MLHYQRMIQLINISLRKSFNEPQQTEKRNLNNYPSIVERYDQYIWLKLLKITIKSYKKIDFQNYEKFNNFPR